MFYPFWYVLDQEESGKPARNVKYIFFLWIVSQPK
jgi:hypothetical protein